MTTDVNATTNGRRERFTMESRVVGSTFYVKVPEELAAAYGNPSTPWIAASMTARAGADTGLRNRIPIELLLALPAAGSNLRQTTPHTYKGQINFETVLSRLPEDLRARVTAYFGREDGAEFARLLGLTADISAVIDARGRVVSINLWSARGARLITVQLSDLGVAVSVVHPPAHEVSPAVIAARSA